jgi:ribosomal protein S20
MNKEATKKIILTQTKKPVNNKLRSNVKNQIKKYPLKR